MYMTPKLAHDEKKSMCTQNTMQMSHDKQIEKICMPGQMNVGDVFGHLQPRNFSVFYSVKTSRIDTAAMHMCWQRQPAYGPCYT